MTWDGLQLVIVDNTGDDIWTLARNADGTYTPGNAVLSGELPSDLGESKCDDMGRPAAGHRRLRGR